MRRRPPRRSTGRVDAQRACCDLALRARGLTHEKRRKRSDRAVAGWVRSRAGWCRAASRLEGRLGGGGGWPPHLYWPRRALETPGLGGTGSCRACLAVATARAAAQFALGIADRGVGRGVGLRVDRGALEQR